MILAAIALAACSERKSVSLNVSGTEPASNDVNTKDTPGATPNQKSYGVPRKKPLSSYAGLWAKPCLHAKPKEDEGTRIKPAETTDSKSKEDD